MRSVKQRNIAAEHGEEEEERQEQQPPKNLTRNIHGQIRKYSFLNTVKSLEELDNLRLKNSCYFAYGKPQQILRTCIIPCRQKNFGKKKCAFELLALPSADAVNGNIHVYSHAQHNHSIMSEERRAKCRNEKDLIPDATPPKTFRTVDNIEWKFLQTISEYGKLDKFRHKNRCKTNCCARDSWRRIRYNCNNKLYSKCQFMLLALKTTKQRYHVYKHGEHMQHRQHRNTAFMSKLNQEEQIDDEEEKEQDGCEDDDKQYDASDDNEEEYEEKPQERYELLQKPAKKITKNILGQIRKYYFLETVKSVEELDKIRFKNSCCFRNGKPSQILKSRILPCSRKRDGKRCDFELLALPSADEKNGNIHVYAHAQHNHPLLPDDKRAIIRGEKELKSDENPPTTFCTPDNIEWTFIKTSPDYEKMNEFRVKNQCNDKSAGREKILRIRFHCRHKPCKFMLLALKTTKQGYHLYKHGKHNNHPTWNQKNIRVQVQQKQSSSAKGHRNREKQKQMEEDEEEDEKDDEEDEEEEEEEEEEDDEEEEEEDDEEEEGEGEDDEDKEDKEDDKEDEDEEEEYDEEKKDIKLVLKYEGNEEEPMEEEQTEVQPIKKEVKEDEDELMEVKIIEIIQGNSREETLKKKLAKANKKVYKWMAGIQPNAIEGTIGDWDKLSLLKMVEMADQEIRHHPEKLNLWLPWLNCAVPKCLAQIEGFNVRFKDLLKLAFD